MMDSLESLLDQIRAALLRADFATAASLGSKLDAGLVALPARPDAARLARLKAMAERNTLFLDAARKGIRAARRRVEEVRRASNGVQAYDGQGRMADIPALGRTAGRF